MEIKQSKKIEDGSRPKLELNGRRITLEDGRYMVFYTFDLAGSKPGATEISVRPDPDQEEKNV